jgi:hypothetical protein
MPVDIYGLAVNQKNETVFGKVGTYDPSTRKFELSFFEPELEPSNSTRRHYQKLCTEAISHTSGLKLITDPDRFGLFFQQEQTYVIHPVTSMINNGKSLNFARPMTYQTGDVTHGKLRIIKATVQTRKEAKTTGQSTPALRKLLSEIADSLNKNTTKRTIEFVLEYANPLTEAELTYLLNDIISRQLPQTWENETIQSYKASLQVGKTSSQAQIKKFTEKFTECSNNSYSQEESEATMKSKDLVLSSTKITAALENMDPNDPRRQWYDKLSSQYDDARKKFITSIPKNPKIAKYIQQAMAKTPPSMLIAGLAPTEKEAKAMRRTIFAQVKEQRQQQQRGGAAAPGKNR